MAKRLSEDHIKWILSLDASGADAEIGKLDARTAQLNRANKDLKKSMDLLTSRGKENSDEFKTLSLEYKKNTEKILKNREAVKLLVRQTDISTQSFNNLKRLSRDLQNQLDNTSQSLHPQEWDKLNNNLQEVKKRMYDLRTESNLVKKELNLSSIAKGMAIGLGVSAIESSLNLLKSAGSQISEFVSSGIELASVADGVSRAFDGLNRPDLLANLRQATKSTVTDLELMKASVQAKDFRIPLDDLGKYLQFAQLKAQQTGQSVDYMTNSIVTGLGRKSVMILDNLGLSAAEINEEVSKTGDFMKAVASIVDRQLAQAGESYVSQADKVTQRTVALENAKLKLGNRLLWLQDKWGALKLKMADFINKGLSSASEAFEEHKNKTLQLTTTMPSLISEYEALKAKTNLSASEQARMKDIIKQVADQIPGAVSEFNKYGEAVSLSTDKIQEFVERQKIMFNFKNKKAIKEAEGDIKNLTRKMNILKSQINAGGQQVYTSAGGVFGPPSSDFKKFSDDQILAKQQELSLLGEQLRQTEILKEELTGDSIEKSIQLQNNKTAARQRFLAMNKDQLNQWISDEANANDQFLSLAKDLYQTRFAPAENFPDDQALKTALDNQASLYLQAQIALKQQYTSGNNENLQNQQQFNSEMEKLALQDMHARLAIYGVGTKERMQIESQILDFKTKLFEQELKKEEQNRKIQEEWDKEQIKQKEVEMKYKLDYLAKNQSSEELFKMEQYAAGLISEQQYKDALLAIENKYLDEKLRLEGLTEEQITDIKKKQLDNQISKNEENNLEIESQIKAQVETYRQYGAQMGEALGNVLSGQEDMLSSFGNVMIDILFDVLTKIVNAKLAEVTASSVANIASSTMSAYATPDSVLTFGASGTARAAVLTGLITAALGAAKSGLKGLLKKSAITSSSDSSSSTSISGSRVVTGFESGGYIDVRRRQDNKQFNAQYNPLARGFIDSPTVIVGEGPAGKSKEWVASNAAVENPTIAPILSIIDAHQRAGSIRTLDINKLISAKMIGYESGGNISSDITAPQKSNISTSDPILRELASVLKSLQKNGIPASVALTELERKQQLLSKSRKIGSK